MKRTEREGAKSILPWVERKPHALGFERIPNLYNLDKDQESVLMREIKKFKGTVIVVVHPFYNWGSISTTDLQGSKNLESKYERALRRSSLPPIFVLSTRGEINMTRALISKIRMKNYRTTHIKDNHLITILPTKDDEPTPDLFSPWPDKYKTTEELTEENWKMMCNKLEGMGIKKIILSGVHFLVGEAKLPEKLGGIRTLPVAGNDYLRQKFIGPDVARKLSGDMHGCVAEAANRLAKHFGVVKISSSTYPHGKKEVNRWLKGLPPEEGPE